MPPIKDEVNGWRLIDGQPGNYEYEKRVGNQVFRLYITKYEKGGFWEMGAAGGSDAERLGGASNMEETFQEARNKAYCFMNRFKTNPMYDKGYNDVVEAADSCGWERY